MVWCYIINMQTLGLIGFGVAALSGLIYYKRNTLQNPAQMKLVGIAGMVMGSVVVLAAANMDKEPTYF